ncbi:uroporphyrinogen-III C-methyltransferase [Candidatus Accumulibacter sp. ACC007]|uniref:uroporphyrinogen-III C-methyltransferase n=1 Tax=Candidatus Accumulibacter sp. ACC007 TaxID=2823333 RepID=UPI0025C2E5C5|nr:uroporphyrinogen-III C-methyltransferase [Candidatus Accumulibacter sp. ACC007]
MMKEEIDPRSPLSEQAAAESAGKPPPEEQPSAGTRAEPESESLPAGEQRPETGQVPEAESPVDKEPLPESRATTPEDPPRAEVQASAESAAQTPSPASQPTPDSAQGTGQPPASRAAADQQSPGWRSPWLLVVLVALGLAGWQWFETREKLADTQQELARRLADSDSSGAEIRALSKGATEQVAGVLGRLAALEGKIGESQSQQAMLEKLYQDIARNRDEWALAEVEQSVTLAAQQLQLAGNVQAAVLALQTADARLAASSRPQFVSLRKVLSNDLDRLRALPQIDVAAMSLRLESVINAIDTIPLAVDGRSRPNGEGAKESADGAAAEVSSPPAAEWPSVSSVEFWEKLVSAELWQRLGREIWAKSSR